MKNKKLLDLLCIVYLPQVILGSYHCLILFFATVLDKSKYLSRQTAWIQIRLLLQEQSGLGLHCLSKRLVNISTDDKTDGIYCDWRLLGFIKFNNT